MDTPDEKPDIQSSLQDGFSRLDETARRVADDAAKKGDELAAKGEDLADKAQGYAHQGLETANKAGQAVAGAIRERPFVSLMVAGLTGAMIALAGRMR